MRSPGDRAAGCYNPISIGLTSVLSSASLHDEAAAGLAELIVVSVLVVLIVARRTRRSFETHRRSHPIGSIFVETA